MIQACLASIICVLVALVEPRSTKLPFADIRLHPKLSREIRG
jgi:hypothetical protein